MAKGKFWISRETFKVGYVFILLGWIRFISVKIPSRNS